MQCFIHARDSGKLIRVVDRIAGTDAFDGFVDADGTIGVDVASNDGQHGLVDTYKRLSAQNPWTIQDTAYPVGVGETIEFEDP